MRRVRAVWRLCLMLFAFGCLCAASATAKTLTVGQLFTPKFSCVGSPNQNYTVLQTAVASGKSYRVPKTGLITSWSFHDGAAKVPGLRLKVGRGEGAGMYKIVAQAKAGAQRRNSVNTYKTHIHVKAGDVIGIYENGGNCGKRTHNALDQFVSASGNVPPGTTSSFQGPFTGFKFPVSVQVTPK
jgi:hypothetical protein